MLENERLTSAFWAVAIFGVVLWGASAMCGMTVPDFTIQIVGPFVAAHPWVPIVLAAFIVAMLFDDVLDRCLCVAWDAAAYLLKTRAEAVATDPDAQTKEVLAARQLN